MKYMWRQVKVVLMLSVKRREWIEIITFNGQHGNYNSLALICDSYSHLTWCVICVITSNGNCTMDYIAIDKTMPKITSLFQISFFVYVSPYLEYLHQSMPHIFFSAYVIYSIILVVIIVKIPLLFFYVPVCFFVDAI